LTDRIRNIVLIGAGNVAWHLGDAFLQNGIKVLQVFSRTPASAGALAEKLNCNFTCDISQIVGGADMYLFSVTDSALSGCIEEFPHREVLLAHTSGSIGIDILRNTGCRAGVFYPLQTFSRNVPLNMSDIPICIEASDTKDEKLLDDLAQTISSDVRKINSEQREILHLAAVFACNFTNHMFAIADEILASKQIRFDIMAPLIRETIAKISGKRPGEVQTGPAVRNDQLIMQKHMQRLSHDEHYQKIYRLISQSIIDLKNKP
jgi:predicted short-subunit dehydrogenase-like oxidoreductase (DUF2520 family)